MLVDPGFLRFGRAAGGSRGVFQLAFGQGFVEGGFGLFEGDASAAAVDFLAGETLGGHFNVGGQQHHLSLGNSLAAQRVTCAHRALGFHLQLIAQALGRLLQGFGGHEGVGHACGARGHRHQARGLGGGHSAGRRRIHLGLRGAPAQYRVHVLQGLGRGALQHPFADEPGHVQRTAADHQHPLGRVQGGRR